MAAFKLIAAIGIAGCVPLAPASASQVEKSELEIARDYFDALTVVYRAGSTDKDIDRLLALMTDDVEYLHVNYQARFDRAAWRAAFLRIQQGGGYNKRAEECIAILDHIDGENAIALDYAYGETGESGDCEPEDRRHLIVFKVRDGKIAKIEELW